MLFTAAIIAAFAPLVAFGAPGVPAVNVAPRSTGLTLDPNLGDGVFLASLDANGNVNVTKLGDIDVSRRSVGPVAPLAARDLPITNGGCGASIPPGDFDTAKNRFNRQCDEGNQAPPGGALIARAGLAVAYMCSWGGWNPCSSGEYNDFIHWAAGRCGNYRSAWADMDSWKKQYGIHHDGEPFCNGWTL
ncbi:hypothetical protein QBC34DRAFT_455104 [Podospora aff. communis PSN243]|uniref:Ecp2 effector protein domain-containing protein n=1 Tax=Podospora aff. communis PSN243 TaxID=3040156 RepID=A0AAV9FZU6_9PEZI|nr:hypothetical protein QBC34DRAFT_455104 [Podospora aff. communis PSN243]